MRIEHVIVAVIVIWAGLVFVRAQSRSALDKAKPSLPVRAMQAAGANVEAKRLIPAVAELGERAVVALAGRARETVSARVGGARERRAERREERRAVRDERLGDFGQRVRDIAAKAGALVGDTATRRWEGRAGDRPMVDRPTRTEAEDGGDLGDPAIHATAECPRCHATVKGVVPASEHDHTVTCRCGHRITFYRKPNDPPDEPQPAATTATTDTQEDSMTATDERTTATAPNSIPASTGPATAGGTPAVPAPADWRALAIRVADFNPDDDADLINFMTQEIAGMAAYASAYEAVFQTCTGSLGLDPRSVQALGEFGENFVQITAEMARARARFVAIYEEVMRMVADGTVMPHNGRFFTGNVPV
ncbi:hypothetical protein ABZW49_20195 [Nonomuraea wenchangensis]